MCHAGFPDVPSCKLTILHLRPQCPKAQAHDLHAEPIGPAFAALTGENISPVRSGTPVAFATAGEIDAIDRFTAGESTLAARSMVGDANSSAAGVRFEQVRFGGNTRAGVGASNLVGRVAVV